MTNYFKGKTILVTGGTGTIGSELVIQLLTHQPAQIRILSRDESKQYYLMEKTNHHPSLRFLIGDIRDRERLDYAMKGVDVVFHAAALKHVPLCEYNPFEAVKTNVLGSQNAIDSAIHHNIEKFIAISTDKAANPNNVMGTSKLMMEKLVVNANYYSGSVRTKFSCVRFGNVAWARGSVLPLWQKQAERNGSIAITNKRMTRFFMSQHQAIQLILQSAIITRGGEIFILKMPSITMGDLATLFLKKHFPKKIIKIKTIPPRPGEKMHEELFVHDMNFIRVYENKELIILIPNLDLFEMNIPKKKYNGFVERKSITDIRSDKHINQNAVAKII